jgi:hypothetical protein
MKKESSRSLILPLFTVPVGGLLTLGICYLLYFALYMFVESQFYAANPSMVPAGIIRKSFSAALLLIYLLLLRTKIPDLVKAILLIGPLAMLLIAFTLAFYETLAVVIVGIAAVTACCVFLIYRYKKVWFYYYAVAVSVAAAIIYAWPRS